jgi:Autophagocytosis associated protein, active-site domain
VTSLHLQPHPLLGTPWFGVHPCRTADLMALVLPGGAAGSGFRESGAPHTGNPVGGGSPAGKGDAGGPPGSGAGTEHSVDASAVDGGAGQQEASWPLRYLLAWFSVVGAAAGLRLPPAAWQLAARPQ